MNYVGDGTKSAIIGDEVDLRDIVFKIEAHSRYQDEEIAVLKTALEEERKTNGDLKIRFERLENSFASINDTSEVFKRNERPARLLPLQLLQYKKNIIERNRKKKFNLLSLSI